MGDHTGSFPIQIISDLHLEIERPNSQDQPLYIYEFPICAPNLALLGDIGWTRDERLFQWLEVQLSRFERVFMVAGNHEPYASSLEQSTSALEEFSKRCSLARATESTESTPAMGEFVFLNRTRYDVSPTLTILGCTLWSALNPNDLDILSWSLTDFKRIDSFNPPSYESAHKLDLNWLTSTLEDIRSSSSRRVAVFTHHAPTVEGTGDPKYIGGPTNSGFATELTGTSCWGSPLILWAFGHTHWNCDFERQGVRVFSNQRGYEQGGRGFDASKVLLL